eukprot:CAMPEP_0201566104 /NCGR_PEP_ID=MMETSP0190_2-20130828/5653_1 /ASSEMBLY_ACC=CAM_ASM_000263 /TAXON_ID=37353 /ORGANISM="Rosalina sp." /LENGTH=368 /DNA_ID=CAMNT_0047984369 /DNA_START=79 /DNA_END=1185 /DNA_ORIENTATION=-
MRLIILSAHERKMTKVLFNRDDDLVFTAAADNMVCVWDSETGERLGTYEGHTGAIFDCDVDYRTRFLLTGSGDSSVKLWEVSTGKTLQTFKTPVRVSSVQWACGDKLFLATSPQFLQTQACVHIYKNPQSQQFEQDQDEKNEPIKSINIRNDADVSNFSVAKGVWSPLNNQIFALCSDNSLRILDVEKGKQIKKLTFVNNLQDKMKLDAEVGTELTDFEYNKDMCTAVICSRAKYAKMFDVHRWDKPLVEYKCDRALNTVAIHPKLDMVAMGGGKTAQQAALDKRNGKYEALFSHKIFGEEIGKIQTDCFSPLNSMAWNSTGNQLVLGYEQGEAYLFQMDVDFERQFNKRSKQFTSIQKDDSDSDEDF